MKKLAIIGILWAILIHPFLFFQMRDERLRTINSLASLTHEYLGLEPTTNGMVALPEVWARDLPRQLHEIAESDKRSSTTHWVINWGSSVIIAALSIFILRSEKKRTAS
jgi:hypothetical protein